MISKRECEREIGLTFNQLGKLAWFVVFARNGFLWIGLASNFATVESPLYQ